MAAKLSVNLNAIAYLRNRRELPWPSVTGIGRISLEAGAHGLTVHPRPDQRHTRYTDLPELRAVVDEFPDCEFNIEGYPTEEFLGLVEANKPDQVTLVPDDPGQETSDHGWDISLHESFLRSVVQRLKNGGFRVSLFCEPVTSATDLALARELGADRVELFTGPYGATINDADKAKSRVADLAKTGAAAIAEGLAVNAGHDLTVDNLPALVQAIPDLAEVSIGHGLTADALQYGTPETVRRFLGALGG